MSGPRYLVADVVYPETNPAAAKHGKPVAVIDFNDREAVERLAQAYADLESGFAELMPEAWTMPAMRMRQALREFANPKPPKPDEPTGRYAVVEDDEGREWCRIDVVNGYAWQLLGQPSGECRYDTWQNIAAVRVLSDGVTEGGAR